MICFRFLLVLLLGLMAQSFSISTARAQEPSDEIELNDSDLTDPAASKADDAVSFDDFKSDEKTDAPKDTGDLEEPTPDEMTLEPLKGDENQVAEPPPPELQAPEAPAQNETPATAPEAEPPPPQLAEPEAPAAPMGDDQPDLAYEAKLYDIYVNFNSKEMTQEKWQSLIGDREAEVYTILKGDTLWGISQTLFNDGNYWPKIWALNRNITNPHLIKPGNTIRFLLGTESDAPAFAVTEGSEEPAEQSMAGGEAQPEGGAEAQAQAEAQPPPGQLVADNQQGTTPQDEVEIPPPSEVFPPVLKNVPPSLPQASLKRERGGYDAQGISIERRPIADLRDTKFLESFVDEDGIQGVGEIREIESGTMAASVGQYVFVAMPPGRGKPGDVLHAVRRLGKVRREVEEVAARELGFQYGILGEMKLEELISTTTGEAPKDIFRALVIKSITQVEKGAIALEGPMPVIKVSEGEPSDFQTQIVSGSYAHGQRILGLYGLAFLPVGSAQGLRLNQVLTVRANTKIRTPDSPIKESYLPIGKIKVVHVSRRYATAIVTRLWDAIRIGDVTGEGKIVPPDVEKGDSSSSHSKTAKSSAKAETPAAEDKDVEAPVESDPSDLNLDDEDLN